MDDIVIKPVHKKDLNEIVYLRKIFSHPDDPVRHNNDISYYSWHNFDNPTDGGSFWAAYHGEKAVGMLSIVPKPISIYSRRYLIGEACDGFTHPNFQGRKIQSRLYKQNYENALRYNINLIYGSSPSPEYYPILIKKFNFIQLNDINLSQLIRPLNFQSIIKLKLGSHLFSNILSFLLKFPFNLIFKSYDRDKKFSDIESQRETSIPLRYNEFWSKCEGLYDFCIVRDFEYIRWRYFLSPEPYEFYTVNQNNSMIGYYVLKIIPWRNVKIGAIVDYFFSSNDELAFKFMLNKVFSIFISQNIDLIQTYCLSTSPYYKRLMRYGFLPFRKDNILFLNCHSLSELKNKKIKAHYTMGDSDYI